MVTNIQWIDFTIRFPDKKQEEKFLIKLEDGRIMYAYYDVYLMLLDEMFPRRVNHEKKERVTHWGY